MPVLDGPQMSIGARGTFAKLIVYFQRSGQNISRYRAIPHNPDTVNQQTIRSYFSNAVSGYQAENGTTKTAWDTYATTMGTPGVYGFNFYVGAYVKYLIDHSGVEPTGPFMPPS